MQTTTMDQDHYGSDLVLVSALANESIKETFFTENEEIIRC